MLNLNRSRALRIVFSLVLISLSLPIWTCRKVAVRHAVDEATRDSNWPLAGGNPARTSVSEFALQPPLNNIWTYKTSSAPSPTLLAVDGALIFTTLDGRFEVVDIATGERLGRGKCENQHEAACAYRNGYLIFASRYGDNSLSKYDLNRGKYSWKIDAGDIASEPLITPDAIYVSAMYDHIDKYEFESGERIWTFKTDDQHRSSPSLGGDVVVAGCDNGVIYALAARTGKLSWKIETGASVVATPVIFENKVMVGSNDSTFYALNLADGVTLWTFSASTPLFQTAATDGKLVLFGGSDGHFFCLNADDGKELWRFRAGSSVSTTPIIAGDAVYFGSLDRHYYGLSLESGALLWKFETRGRIRTSPIVWENYILGASEDRFVYAFSSLDSSISFSF
jgi:outer membrane protein assembly factor BamB